MPDISMCANKQCPSREQCYRFTAAPSTFQSYMKFEVANGDNKCDYFWDNKEYKNEKRKSN